MSLALNVLIVEDETPASEKLERYLTRYSTGIVIKGIVESVEDAVNWLEANQATIDLIFMDIQLKDGVSFDIFKEVTVQKPVIFITAYNEFALDAFKMNGIDYLLKPITFTDLSNSLKKVEELGNQLRWSEDKNETITKTFDTQSKSYKNRFMVKVGRSYKINYIRSNQYSLCRWSRCVPDHEPTQEIYY
jgi:two-component system LytT family response regulator